MDESLKKDLPEEGSNDLERTTIRSELSNMSFEDMQKLKEELGSKVYKEAMFGVKSIDRPSLKRKNKNYPSEVSSKIRPTIQKKVATEIKDPRFNSLCGTFNEKAFNKSYEFISGIRKKEKGQLKVRLRNETNPKEIERIKFLVQRMDNQDREEAKKAKKQLKQQQEREEQVKALQEGHKPHFRTKYEKKVLHLLDTYTELKKSGKLKKHIEKQRKKQNYKEKNNKPFSYFENNLSG